MMKRKLASVQRIVDIKPVENADTLDVATVLGWHVVTGRNEFKPGDLVVYFEIDSIIPERPEFEFLRKNCYIDKNGFRGFRLRTVKLRGQVSQGLIAPLSILPDNGTYVEGQDVTEILDVVKYDPPLPAELSGLAYGTFPPFIPETDEMRIQAFPGVLLRHHQKEFRVTEKLDGTSVTFFIYDGRYGGEPRFGVCSRKLELKPTETNTYWVVARKLGIEEALKRAVCLHDRRYAIQGEIIGPGIQKNKYALKEHDLRIFSVYNIDDQKYLGPGDMLDLISKIGLADKLVPYIGTMKLDGKTIDDLVIMSNGRSVLNDVPREGIVFRPLIESTDVELGRLSFKVISPVFLSKYKE
ncbi:MAG: RNA ligase (ATP) [Sphaerochaetaceae bacterium]|nr:RNA ligase (ATP) [Sphaerochaetaceae bacterium]